ncbi:Rhodanese-like domain-containing protein [Apiosordaria backusii]|uniref:Rhodanese-like domain-containing protein n=1 Tax=Apiosordaria backusii TaxID=314023 RepID=A0AA40A3Y9_9PEZI|nr:Rhodanese-like domain-containing protein [Apiosordaria backusii]
MNTALASASRRLFHSLPKDRGIRPLEVHRKSAFRMSHETPAAAPPWHAAYPAPSSQTVFIPRDEVLPILANGRKDAVLVDLRRNDFEGGTIRGSLNLPAQSLYPTLPTVYSTLKAAGLKKVIFYCGSSTGRGSRAASWLADYISSQNDTEMQSLALEGGIKGWAAAGPEYVKWMDEYDEKVWAKHSA